MDTKQCSRCKQVLPLSEFCKCRIWKDGYEYYCKKCKHAFASTPEALAKRRLRYASNERVRQWYKDYEKRPDVKLRRKILRHSDRTKARTVRWLKTAKGKLYKKNKLLRYRSKPGYKEKYNSYKRLWSKTEAGKIAALREVNKRRGKGVIAKLSLSDWKDILERYNYRCAYCGVHDNKLTQDHYMPIAKGGHHVKDNIVPSCLRCNLKKAARHPHRLF